MQRDQVGKTVLITGAGSGIGLEMVHQFLDQGAVVEAVDLDCSSVPSAARCHEADVSSAEEVSRFIDAIGSSRAVDVVCNNAGIGSTTDIVGCTEEEWERVFAVNVKSIFLVCRAVIPGMIRGGGGVIINTASVVALKGFSARAAYSASKGAVVSLTRQIAVDYVKDGIRCSCLAPGTVDSPWLGRLLDESDDPETARAELVARQPIGRLGTPAEVAAAAVYLASPMASFVTGTVLSIDGGINA